MRLSTSAKRVSPRPEGTTITIGELKRAKEKRLVDYIRKEEKRKEKEQK